MAYNGSTSKNVSSAYLYTTLQAFYTKIKGLLAGKSDTSHTHKYAGSSSAGGAATTALACTGNSATATTASNALKLSGYSLSTEGATDTWGKIPIVGSDGVIEIGKYIDFHTTDGNTADYDVRITATTSGLTLSGTTIGAFSGKINGFTASSSVGYYLRPISYGTSSLTPGATSLTTGSVYLQYE